MSGEVLPLIAYGDHVWVQTITPADLAPYRRAVLSSADRIRRWNPVNPDDLMWHLGRQSTDHRTFLIHAHQRRADHDIVGKVNLLNVVRGRFQSGTMGYDAYDPYAGTGLFAEGLRLVVGLAFAPLHEGMGLHRVEADVRPGNEVSAGLLRSLGFRREGHVRDMLWLDAEGIDRWCDHDTYAVTAPDWPAQPFRPHAPLRLGVVVAGGDPDARLAWARSLAAELTLPLLSGRVLGVEDPEPLHRLLAESPIGAVVEHSWKPVDLERLPGELRSAGLDPQHVPVIRCGGSAGAWAQPSMPHLEAPAAPDDRAVCALALRVRSLHT